MSEALADPEDQINDALEKRMAGRKMASNASYFAFTATPKNKTLECSVNHCRRTPKAKSSTRLSTVTP